MLIMATSTNEQRIQIVNLKGLNNYRLCPIIIKATLECKWRNDILNNTELNPTILDDKLDQTAKDEFNFYTH